LIKKKYGRELQLLKLGFGKRGHPLFGLSFKSGDGLFDMLGLLGGLFLELGALLGGLALESLGLLGEFLNLGLEGQLLLLGGGGFGGLLGGEILDLYVTARGGVALPRVQREFFRRFAGFAHFIL